MRCVLILIKAGGAALWALKTLLLIYTWLCRTAAVCTILGGGGAVVLCGVCVGARWCAPVWYHRLVSHNIDLYLMCALCCLVNAATTLPPWVVPSKFPKA